MEYFCSIDEGHHTLANSGHEVANSSSFDENTNSVISLVATEHQPTTSHVS